ncbi:Solute carrier organic anion transporter family member 1A5 [Armadillidium vulgare]|nr:Solute carrier organic anion transporter family member 1A5 [Armadillidium vulgare]
MTITAIGLLITFTTLFIYPPPTITESGKLSNSKKYCSMSRQFGNATVGPPSDPQNLEGVDDLSCYESNSLVFFVWFFSYSLLDMSIVQPVLKKESSSSPSVASTYQIGSEYGTIDHNKDVMHKTNDIELLVTDKEEVKPIYKDFASSMKRLAKNKTLVLTATTDVFAVTGILGFFIWLPKYLEHQFRIDKSESALYTGLAGTSSVIIGVLGGGILIRQCQPSAKTLVILCASCKAIYIASLVGLMFITCNFNDDFPGYYNNKRNLNVNFPCSDSCSCDLKEFIPVCLREKNTNKSQTCSSSPSSNVTLGYCEKTCSMFTVYNLVNVIIKSFISVGAIGNLLLNLRCVDPKDKAIALGLKGTMIALGLLIAPLVFGALADSSCILWEEACGKTGSCWVYDTQDFSYKLHGGCLGFFLISLICDIVLSQNVSHVILTDGPLHGSSDRRTSLNGTSVSSISLNSNSTVEPFNSGTRSTSLDGSLAGKVNP